MMRIVAIWITSAAVVALALPATAADCTPGEPQVRYRGGKLTLTICLSAVAERCAEKPCYLGATMRRAKDGFHYDVPAKEIRAAEMAKPVTLSAKVGAGYTEIFAGIWERKEDCRDLEIKRHGCDKYGYVLTGAEMEESGWTHPEWDFWGVAHPFAKLAPPRIQLLDAGGGTSLLEKAKAALSSGDRPFTDGGAAKNRRDRIEVLYRNAWERPHAWKIAKQLKDAEVGVDWLVKHWPGAPEDFVLAVGAPAR